MTADLDPLTIYETLIDRVISDQACASIATNGINETHMKIFDSLAHPDGSPNVGSGIEFEEGFSDRLREAFAVSTERRKRKRYIEVDTAAKISIRARLDEYVK